MARWGALPEQAAAFIGQPEPEELEVLPDNWAALEWWLAVDDLLRFEQGIPLGLDVVAVEAEARLSGRETTPAMFGQLRLLAREAVSELNRRRQ